MNLDIYCFHMLDTYMYCTVGHIVYGHILHVPLHLISLVIFLISGQMLYCALFIEIFVAYCFQCS